MRRSIGHFLLRTRASLGAAASPLQRRTLELSVARNSPSRTVFSLIEDARGAVGRATERKWEWIIMSTRIQKRQSEPERQCELTEHYQQIGIKAVAAAVRAKSARPSDNDAPRSQDVKRSEKKRTKTG